MSPRTVRKYVAELRGETHPPECFVYRTHESGKTMEGDFGTTWATVAGKLCQVKYVVSTLPASRAHFAKAYPLKCTEFLLDGMLSAFKYFGGLTSRAVLPWCQDSCSLPPPSRSHLPFEGGAARSLPSAGKGVARRSGGSALGRRGGAGERRLKTCGEFIGTPRPPPSA